MTKRRSRSMVRLAALAGAVALAATGASMLSNLRHALSRRQRTQESERARVRRALKPILMDFDRAAWEETFGRLPEGFDREAFIKSLPKLDPPLSATIISERDEQL